MGGGGKYSGLYCRDGSWKVVCLMVAFVFFAFL